MKSKFISVIVSVAVVLGLMLVPAAISADPGDEWAYEIEPEITTASASSSFSVNITAVQWDTGDSDGWEAYVRYDPTYLNVTGITIPSTLPPPNNLAPDKYLAPGAGIYGLTTNPGYNNTEGILYVGYSPAAASPKLNTTFWFATIDFATTAAEGVTSIDFVDVDAGHITEILLGATEVQNWAKFVNGTVIIGTPNLQVCVNPVGTGSVKADGTPLVMDVLGCNITARDWSPPSVSLVATPVAGYEFENWTGDVSDPNATSTTVTIDTTTMNMTTLTKSVTANFAEMPPILDVDPNHLDLDARWGGFEDNETVTISNLGGHLLNWRIGSPPEWCVNDSWTWYNFYNVTPSAPPTNTVTMNVTNTSDPDVYVASVDFTPPAPRVLNLTNPADGYLYPNATVINGTVWVDKYSLDFVQQYAVLSVPALGGSGMVYATLTYDVTAGNAGWPYSVSNSWMYKINATLVTPIGTIVEPTRNVTAVVTNLTNVTAAFLGSVPLGMPCYETTHLLDGTTPFMWTYWNDDIRAFVATYDVGTYNYPPIDLRVLAGAPTLHCPPPVQPPSWVSFDKTSGSLGISGSEDLTVTANSSGLAEGGYNGSFTISAPGTIQEEPVTVNFTVLAPTTTDVLRDLPGNAMQLNQTYPGDTFDVYVNFTAPFNQMNAISLTDLAPDGWEVAVDAANCTANGTIPADYVKATGNKVEITWWGDPNVGFDVDTEFSALYQVTVPETAKPGINEWPLNDGDKAWAEYYQGEADDPKEPYSSNVTDEYQMMITVPGYATGETRDVNAKLLPDTAVTLKKGTAFKGQDESTPDYSIECRNTGVYWLRAMKDAYYTVTTPEIGGHPIHNANHTEYINWSTAAQLANSYHIVDGMNVADLDFEGDYGLVPQSCTMSYAMKSVNLYVFSPAPVYDIHNGVVTAIDSFGLSVWKATRSVMSWQNPYHS